MKDKARMEHVERWARFVRDNPRRVWKPEVDRLVNSHIEMANRFYSRLEKMPGGKEKVRKLMGLKNCKGVV